MATTKFCVIMVLVMLTGICCAVKQSNTLNPQDIGTVGDREVLDRPGKSLNDSSQCENPFWTGDVGGKRIVWDSEDIYVYNNNLRVPMFQPSFKVVHDNHVRQIKKSLRANTRKAKDSESHISSDFQNIAYISLKSVVGDIVSFEIEYGEILEGSPVSHNLWWLTLNMSKFRKYEPFLIEDIQNTDVVASERLSDIFNSSDIVRELLTNQNVIEYSKSQQIKDLESLLNTMLDEKQSISTPRLQIDKYGNFLTPYSFEHFIFDRIENSNAVVKVALVNFSHTQNYHVEYLEMALPIPDSYLTRFEKARDGIDGFLASNKLTSLNCVTKLRKTSQLAEE